MARSARKPYRTFSLMAPAFLICISLTTALTAQEQIRPERGLKITLMLYSGRPNPAFVLEDRSVINTIKSIISRLKPGQKKEARSHPILGYCGIVVENINGTVAEFPALIHIQRQNVEMNDGGKRLFENATDELENFLLNLAREKEAIDKKTFLSITGAAKGR